MRPDETDTWPELGERLAGAFRARARGLAGTDLVLLARDGEPFGRMLLRGLEGADVEAGGPAASIVRAGRSGYRMSWSGASLSAEGDGLAGKAEIRLNGRRYEARTRLLRNLSVAHSAEGGEAARVTGGLTNRRYSVAFDAGDDGALPVALFLLYRTVALRRWAFLASSGGGRTEPSPGSGAGRDPSGWRRR